MDPSPEPRSTDVLSRPDTVIDPPVREAVIRASESVAVTGSSAGSVEAHLTAIAAAVLSVGRYRRHGESDHRHRDDDSHATAAVAQ